jgi:tetratricopeptide (TPR) repeat protein
MLLSRFREQLRSSEWAERERVPLAAGFAILCVVARRIDTEVRPDESDVEIARNVLRTLPKTPASTALGALLRVLDEDPMGPAGPALMEYGHALENDGAYEFAADVYQLAAELGRREQGLLLAPAALVRVGACLRNVGRYREAEKAYRAGAAVAQEIGDLVTELMSNIGRAKIAIEQDRYGAARNQLNQVIASARARDLRHPLALALHDRGALANREGDLEDGLVDFGEALSLQRDHAEQIRILADVGVTLRKLGLVEIARDVFVCVRDESPQFEARCTATINLLALAADQRQWDEFDRLEQALGAVTLSPYRHCEFLETLAHALTLRGCDAQARTAYQTLLGIARKSEHKEFERLAQRALSGERVSRLGPPPSRALPQRCRPAIDTIRNCVLAASRPN